MTLDALVVGAGPAGTIASAKLAADGWGVGLLDPAAAGRRALGESLPGPALALLRSAGFEPAAAHQRLTGVVSLWGDVEPHHDDFLRSPFGCGLRLDRERFDADLVSAARASGVSLIRGRLRSMRRVTGGYLVTTDAGEVLEPRWLIDATGRASAIARRAGARRKRRTPLFSVSAIVSAAVKSSRTIVETTPDGWWYATDIGGDRLVVSFQCDGVLARVLHRGVGFWRERLALTRLVSPLLYSAESGNLPLAICDAAVVHLDIRHGPRWLALGDAAAAYDPVTSHGLYAAIRDGTDGAVAISAALRGDDVAVAGFDAARVSRYAFVERQTRAAYVREMRWPDAPFWASQRCEGVEHGQLRGDR